MIPDLVKRKPGERVIVLLNAVEPPTQGFVKPACARVPMENPKSRLGEPSPTKPLPGLPKEFPTQSPTPPRRMEIDCDHLPRLWPGVGVP